MSLSLLAAAAEHPSRTALIVDGIEHSYASLAARARRIMAALRAEGVGAARQPPPVAIVATARVETVLAILSLVELGVPAVLIDPRLTASERQHLLEEVAPALVLDEQWHEPQDAPLDAEPPPPVDDERALAIVFTGGTTGRPKGALLSRRAFIAAAEASAENLGWQDDDRWLLCMPLAHVGGLSILTRCLCARRCVVLSSQASFDPRRLMATLADQRVTLVSMVPTMLKRVLDAAPDWSAPPRLRAILLGGAAASPSLLEHARARKLPVLTTYGLTEACSQVTTQRYGTSGAADEGVGHPVRGTEVRIVAGHIQVRGPTLMRGYFPLDKHPCPFTSDGWLPTGDLGRLDDQGCLHILSRRTDLIITGGENVYPVEVEEVLERHPAIVAACVIGVPDQTWGQVVAAVLVPKGTPPDPGELEAWLRERLAPHKRPRRIALIAELPLTAAGKVDRAAVVRGAKALRPLPGG